MPPSPLQSPKLRWRVVQGKVKELVEMKSDECDANKAKAQAEQYEVLVLHEDDSRSLFAVLDCAPEAVNVDQLRAELARAAGADCDPENIKIVLRGQRRQGGAQETEVTAAFSSAADATSAVEKLRGGQLRVASGKLRPRAAAEQCVADRMRECSEWLEEAYAEKEGDVADELLENLRLPPTSVPDETKEQQGLSRLAALCRALNAEVGAQGAGELRTCCGIELLCLRQYTQRPIDIDRDLGWKGVPPPPQAGEIRGVSLSRSVYEQQFEDWDWKGPSDRKRNGSIFGPVCAALRDIGPGGSASAASEQTLTRWVKWLCTVAAVCAEERPKELPTLWRGIGAGGLSADIVDRHRHLREGSLLAWPALSSTSLDAKQSEAYMRGTAVNSVGSPSFERPGTLLFRMEGARWGLPVSLVSQYPAEQEILLPPLSVFRVVSTEPDAPHNTEHGLRMTLAALGPLGEATPDAQERIGRFFARVRRDARQASARLSSVTPNRALTRALLARPQLARQPSGAEVPLGGAAREAALRAAPRGHNAAWESAATLRERGSAAAHAAHLALKKNRRKAGDGSDSPPVSPLHRGRL